MTNLDDIVKDLYNISDMNLNGILSDDDFNIDSNTLNSSSGWTNGTVTYPIYPTTGTGVGWSPVSPTGGWTTTINTGLPGMEIWPSDKSALGLVYIDDNLIKLRTKNGKEVVIGKLDESEDEDIEVLPLQVIAVKKQLLEA
jgi:hypothetical protein